MAQLPPGKQGLPPILETWVPLQARTAPSNTRSAGKISAGKILMLSRLLAKPASQATSPNAQTETLLSGPDFDSQEEVQNETVSLVKEKLQSQAQIPEVGKQRSECFHQMVQLGEGPSPGQGAPFHQLPDAHPASTGGPSSRWGTGFYDTGPQCPKGRRDKLQGWRGVCFPPGNTCLWKKKNLRTSICYIPERGQLFTWEGALVGPCPAGHWVVNSACIGLRRALACRPSQPAGPRLCSCLRVYPSCAEASALQAGHSAQNHKFCVWICVFLCV